jgi:hypothetical protein
VSTAAGEKKRGERKVGRRGDLGRWAGGEGSRPVGRKEEGRIEGFSFFKTFSNLNTSNCFQNFQKHLKTFKTLNQHTKHYAAKI